MPDVGTDFTVDDLERLPKVEGYVYELDRARLRITAAPANCSWHGEMSFRVVAWFRGQGQAAFPEGGVVLKDRTTHTPDVCVFWSRPQTSGNTPTIRPTLTRPWSRSCRVAGFCRRRPVREASPVRGGRHTYLLAGGAASDDQWDAMVQIFQLGPTGYTVTRTAPLSELEKDDQRTHDQGVLQVVRTT